MGCEKACGDCSKDCGDRLVDIEDYEAELIKLRARTKELEETMARIKNEETDQPKPQTRLRSADWFNRKSDLGMTALYVERYLNSGLTREELMSNKPIIGIAQSGSDIAPVSLFSLLVVIYALLLLVCRLHLQVIAEHHESQKFNEKKRNMMDEISHSLELVSTNVNLPTPV